MTIISTTEASKQLQVSSDTVLRLIRSGELPASRLKEGGYWRIRQEDLDEYAQQRGVELAKVPQK